MSDGPIQAGEIEGAGNWSPANSDGKYGGTRPCSYGLIHSRNTMSVRVGQFAGSDAVQKVAEDRGVSMAEVALSWVTDRPAVTSTILCARTGEQLEANLKAAGLHLTAEETAALNESSDPGAADYPYGTMGQDQRSRLL